MADKGYTPVLLVVREDNLPAAMSACEAGGWTIHKGKQSFDYIKKKTHFDLFAWLVHHQNAGTFLINRK